MKLIRINTRIAYEEVLYFDIIDLNRKWKLHIQQNVELGQRNCCEQNKISNNKTERYNITEIHFISIQIQQ